MKLAFVSNVVYPFVKGGTEKRVYEVGRRLVERGHEVTVYGRKWWEGDRVRWQEGMRLVGVSPRRELYSGERRSIPEALEFAKDVVRPLRRDAGDLDVVVVNGSSYFPAFGATLGTALTGTPVVVEWHEVWRDSWGEYLGRLAPFGQAVERMATKVPGQRVAVSSTTADRLAELGPDRESIEVVPNGIDVEEVRSIEPVEDGFDVVYAGRLVDFKNVDVAMEAFDRVAGEFDATMGVIGDGPERERLEEVREELEHGDRVTLTGFLDEYRDVLRHMKAADVFVSASEREGFGITFIEAMAAGCTVVAVDHPWSTAAEVVGDGGFLTDPSVDGVETGLRRALRGEEPGRDPVEAAARYDWDRVAEMAEAVYRGAAERGSRA